MKKALSMVLALILICSVSTNIFVSALTIEEIVKGTVNGTIEVETKDIEKDSKKVNSDHDKQISDIGLKYSDVYQTAWFYEPVMKMTSLGLFSGTSTPINGVGTFSPYSEMTRAEFLTTVLRYLYPEELTNPNVGKYWYSGNYKLGISKGMIKENEFTELAMNQPMTRQEMAMILVRACEKLGEQKGKLIELSSIPDNKEIGSYFSEYVRLAYSKGMIAGVDSKGTFNPLGTLTRGQAATVLYRLVDPDARMNVNIDTSEPIEKTGVQIFYEGEKHNKPQEGDICIKKDGTRVVVERDEYGILRARGCDIYTGVVINGVTVREGLLSWYDQRPFAKDEITGEMLSIGDWVTLRGYLNPTHIRKGNYDGETLNTWYQWDTQTGLWLWIGPM